MPSNSISFDRAADYYDDTRGFPPGIAEQVGAFIAQVSNLSAGSRILEVGVGTGRIAIPLSAHVGTLIGVDLSRVMMNRLRQKAGSEDVNITQADIIQLPFSSQSFDAVIAVHVFHLIPEWQRALSEVARVLRPGAALLQSWSEADKNQKLDLLRRLWYESRQNDYRVGMDAEDYDAYLPNHGWQKGKLHVFPYQGTLALSDYVNRLKNRVWSRLWSMSDHEIEQGILAVEAAIGEYFDSPDEVLELKHSFCVQVWRKSQSGEPFV